ncbi:MAG: sulfotransferase [Alphaproteobacteria bacterium]|nr:sulfotransferase [Alphaproteobacteria bacterium]
MTQPFFITGFLRSGTTLLEKLLHNHPQIAVASQPFPYLFLRTKQDFFHEMQLPVPRYPLGDLFLENRYTRGDFLRFMQSYTLSEAVCREELDRMRGYSGQMTPELLDMLAERGHLAQVFRSYASTFPELLRKPSTHFSGSKEVFCEEFIPYFLSEGIPTLLIIRDPRAVVNSIHSGRGSTYANSGLTVLQILRAWRKSVAYAMRFEGSPNFHLIRHEQLAENPQTALRKVFADWNLPPLPDSVMTGEIRAQDGSLWRGNSSFSSPKTATPRYLEMLDRQTLEFIETVCAPEMRWLEMDFHTDASHKDRLEIISGFRDMFQKDAPALETSDAESERRRLRMCDENDVKNAEKWFIFSENTRFFLSGSAPHNGQPLL